MNGTFLNGKKLANGVLTPIKRRRRADALPAGPELQAAGIAADALTYCARKVAQGSTRAARAAGSQDATIATPQIVRSPSDTATGSNGGTS